MTHRIINICLFIVAVLIFNCFNAYPQSNFSKKTSLGVTAQFSYGSYHKPLFIELSGESRGKEYTLGMIIKYDISRKFDIETGVLLTMQEGIDYRIYWSDMHRYFNFNCYSDNMLYIQIPTIAKFYPLGNENNNIYPILDFGVQTGILLGGVRTIYSFSENDTDEDIFNVKYRETFSIFNHDIYNSYKYKVYNNLILGGGVNINYKKLNIYCGINFPIGLINNSYSQFSVQSATFITAIYF